MPDSATPLPPARQRPEATRPRLGGRWRFIAAFGWAVILAAASRLAVTARHLEHAPAWLPIWWLLALFPLATVLAAARHSRWLPWTSIAATAAIAFASGWDLASGRAGIGRYEASLACSGAALTAVIWATRLAGREAAGR